MNDVKFTNFGVVECLIQALVGKGSVPEVYHFDKNLALIGQLNIHSYIHA